MKKALILLPLLFILSLLQGCHGSNNNTVTSSTVHLVNGVSSPGNLTYPMDLFWSGAASASAVAASVPYGQASPEVGIYAGVSSIAVASHGGAQGAATPYSFSGGYNYTILAYPTYPSGTNGQMSVQTAYLNDYIQIPTVPGEGLLGVADYSGAGSLDVYIGVTGSLSSSSSPSSSGISGLTSYFPLAQGSYQIQVTGHGAGFNNDVRLNIPSATIGNQQILTLVLTATQGGGLVDGLLVPTLNVGIGPWTVQSFKNGSVRVRVAASIPTTLTVNGPTTTIGPLSAGSVSSYVPVPLAPTGVPVGAQPLTIAGSAFTIGSCGASATATPGQDLTLLVVNGSTCYLLADNNTLASSGSANLRLVNGVNNSVGGYSLTYGGLYSQNAALGAASTPVSVPIPGGSPYPLGVSPAVGGTTNLGSPALQPQGVYSMFLLGDTTAPLPSTYAVLTTDLLYTYH